MTHNATYEHLHEIALHAPSSSGVYLWRNADATVIYVGKAKNLKHRLSSYFSGKKDIKTQLLVSNAHSIEYIITQNEYEAFLLENTLIKKFAPRYNINLKDDKSYPAVRITNEPFPRVFKTRNIIEDGSLYFGPYPDAGAVDDFIKTLYRMYPIRHCKILRTRTAPCLYYHIHQCAAPCCKKISKDDYNTFIGEIITLLEKKEKSAQTKIETLMKQAAQNLDFEKAARFRDGLRALERMNMQNIVENFSSEDCDYIAYWRIDELVSIVVLKARNGKIEGKETYRTKSLHDDEDIMGEFFAAYYTDKKSAPPTIYIKTKTSLAVNEFSRWFFETLHANVRVTFPSENENLQNASLSMAEQNAKEDCIRRRREVCDDDALRELQKLFSLEELPRRIEGFDIAHLAGKFPVASLISFYNGNPDKKNYRYFRLQTTDGIIDDFASMREAASRRYTRLLNENKDLPDLVLIDGGIGQVNAVQKIFDSLSLDIKIVGLAKKNEELYTSGKSKPLTLPKTSAALKLLQRVRDETHRFATTQNQKLRTKENTKNDFENLRGVGKKRSLLLAEHFKTLEKLIASGTNEICKVLSVNEHIANEIIESAKNENKKNNCKVSQKNYTVENLAERALNVAENEFKKN